jgi:hypothetical protein
MSFKQAIELNQRVAKYIDRRRFFGWFVGLAVPVTVAMSLFIAWHNDLVGPPQPRHLMLRLAVGSIAYGMIVIIVYWKVFRPAMRKALEEAEHDPPPSDG